MDNQKGGQSNATPSTNAWGQAAAKNAMEQSENRATTELTSAEKQRQTVSDIARQKLLDAYKHQNQDYREPTKQAPAPQVNAEDWRKYHTAWQNYYQKYYGEYYGKAAKEYVARERLKYERGMAEQKRDEEETTQKTPSGVSNIPGAITSTPSPEEVQNDFKSKIQKKVAKRAKKMRKSRHFIPITVGLSILILGLLFQYNQVIIANAVAYMSPGGTEVNDITSIDPTVTASVHEDPTLMIPKLNVEVPVVFGAKNDTKSMAAAMTNGVANFRVPGASAMPGEIGNFVISGHSAGNVYEGSNYKFIFSGLTRMGEGDLIYMDYASQRYTYRVVGTKTVDPSDVASLRQIANDNAGKPMITLITCTPLGTSKYRLLVFGEQIHPVYDGAGSDTPVDGGVDDDSASAVEMPKNSDSPLEQFWKWLTGQE